MITLILSLRSFIVNTNSVPETYTLCNNVNETNCIDNTYSSMGFSTHYNVGSALMTFGSVAVAYYLLLRALSLLFQYCYCITRVVRHFLIILDVIAMQPLFISVFPNSDTIVFHTNIITIQLILHCLFSALMIPWEKVYTFQHMNSRRTSR